MAVLVQENVLLQRDSVQKRRWNIPLQDKFLFTEIINAVELFPNPVIDKLYIFADGSNALKIYNMKGQLMQVFNFSESVEIDMSHAASGMYLFQVIQSNGDIINRRIIKQ